MCGSTRLFTLALDADGCAIAARDSLLQAAREPVSGNVMLVVKQSARLR